MKVFNIFQKYLVDEEPTNTAPHQNQKIFEILGVKVGPLYGPLYDTAGIDPNAEIHEPSNRPVFYSK